MKDKKKSREQKRQRAAQKRAQKEQKRKHKAFNPYEGLRWPLYERRRLKMRKIGIEILLFFLVLGIIIYFIAS